MSTTDTAPPVDPSTLTPLEPACEWRRDDLADGYVFDLTDDHLAELDAALAEAEARTDDVLDVDKERFPLPTLGPELERMTRDLVEGRGVALIRGIPVERYGKDRASTIYWGIGMHVGRPWPQNVKGHLLGDVTDQGKAYDDPTSRGNEIGGVPFPFHSDGSDLVGLFCLDAGASGGASLVANVVTIHNELVRSEPDLAAELYGRFPYDARGEQAPGTKGWYTMPVFSRRGDRLFCRYIRPYITASSRHGDAPHPSPAAVAAMDRLDAMCADPRYHVAMALQPGDIQLVNNYHVLHARDGYVDDRAGGRIRHLKRLWLETALLSDDDKPEAFRLGRRDSWWRRHGPTKSEVAV
ncbi:MAG: TauD/TfdA family dioxygenase [Actinobacteria bacterium]|nr:TauD/TfdA family dioxygenase [Actinomycetota bacterium]